MIVHGDCLDVMRGMDETSVDAIVTDPPYGLGFMGRKWDALPPGIAWARECLRVLKPGGHLLAFGGTRTYHRLACAVEDGGFEIRDCLAWLYGSGFPKGKGCLKPAHEPIVMARKPGAKGVVLNVNACRIGTESTTRERTPDDFGLVNDDGWKPTPGVNGSESGRWPANVILDEQAAAMLDDQTGDLQSPKPYERASGPTGNPRIYGNGAGIPMWSAEGNYGDSGGASRFFYVAKASARERNAGLTDCNRHPTVKPLALMRWLCRLVTPPGGLVLDPFAGSGTTGCACAVEGFEFVSIEREAEYVDIARARIAHWQAQPQQLDFAA